MNPNNRENMTFQVPTGNRFEGLGGVNNGGGNTTGIVHNTHLTPNRNRHLSIDEKLSRLIEKVDNLENSQHLSMTLAKAPLREPWRTLKDSSEGVTMF